MADSRFVCEKPLTFDCDLDLDLGNLNFVCDTLSHFVLSSEKFDLSPVICFSSYGLHTYCNRWTDRRMMQF